MFKLAGNRTIRAILVVEKRVQAPFGLLPIGYTPLLDTFIPLCYSCSRLFWPVRSCFFHRTQPHFKRSSLLSKSRTQILADRLRELQASSPDVEASAIVSVDGLPIASVLPQEVEEDRVSAMSAAMLSLGERIASELGRGALEQVYIKGQNGYVLLMSVGEDAVLTAMARKEAKLGLILLDMRRAAEDLVSLI